MLKKAPSKTSKSKKSKDRDKKKAHSSSDSSSCSPSTSNETNNLNDKTSIENPVIKYSGFDTETMQCIAEQFISETISNDIYQALAEDVSYKMREILQAASINMKQGKRKYLKTDDVNAVFKRFNIEQVYGAALPNWMTFNDPKNYSSIPEKTFDLVALATTKTVQIEPGDIGIDYKWLKDNLLFNQLLINNNLNNYTKKIINAALSETKSLRLLALKDVSENTNIGPIIPHLCNFCFLVLQQNITFKDLTTPTLQLLEAILLNPSTQYCVEEKQMNLLLLLLMEKIINATDSNLDEVIPICRTLGRLCIQWSSGIQIIVDKINKRLNPEKPIEQLSAPVICALIYLGHESLNSVLWPHILAVFKYLKKQDPKTCSELYATILSAANILYKQQIIDIDVERILSIEFGDCLEPLRRLKCCRLEMPVDNEVQTNWFNMKRALLKSRKIHSKQFKNETKTVDQNQIIKRNITILGYKSIPIKTKFAFESTAYSTVKRSEDGVNVITGRRNLILKTLSLNKISSVHDLLYMM